MGTDVKDLREGYKMTELGEIPEEWEIKKLMDLSTKILDGVHATPKYSNDGVKFLSVENITQNNFDSTKYISQEDHIKYSKRCSLEKNDILMTRIGTIGVPKLVDWEFEASIYVSLAQVKLKNKDQAQFITQYMMSSIFKAETLKRSLLSATPQKINLGEIGKIPIILPPINEQKKIAEILSTVDENIEKTDQLLEKTKELKKGLMQQLLTKGIGHTEFKKTELGDIPTEWEVTEMQELCERIIVGIASSTSGYYTDDTTNVPIIRNQNIKENKIDSSDLLYITNEFDEKNQKKRLKQGDLITARTGYPGITAVVNSEFENCQSFTTLISTPDNKKVVSEYLSYFINSDSGKFALKNLSAGGAQQNLNVSSFSKFKVKVPLIKEQKEIVKILSSVDEQIIGYENEKDRLKELKKGMMQQLLTGKIRVMV